jgi:hypothetical protein
VGGGVQAATDVHLDEGALKTEQPFLPVEPARVARELAGRADEPVARDHDRQRIAGVRAAHGPRAVGQTEAQRLLTVRARLAVRNLCERKPRAPLKLRPAGIEREVECAALAGEVLGQLFLRVLDEAARTDRLLVAPLEPLQAALRRDDPQRPKRRQSSAPSSRRSCTFRSRPPA